MHVGGLLGLANRLLNNSAATKKVEAQVNAEIESLIFAQP